MKKTLFMAMAALSLSTASMGQTSVNLPFNGDYGDIYQVGYSNPGLFCCLLQEKNYEVTNIGIYDANLSKIAEIKAGNKQFLSELQVMDCTKKDLAPYDDTIFYVSQHLFNTDDDFEYIVGNQGDYDGGMDKIYIKSTGSMPDIEINPGCVVNTYIHILALGDVNYLILSAREDDSYLWYKVNGASNSVELIKKETGSRLFAYPNPVTVGEQVKLNINGSYTDYDIAVFSMRGNLVKSQTNNDAVLDTDGLTPGFYTYKVASGGKEVGTGKLIIK